MSSDSHDKYDLAVIKFESMLKSNKIYFFDAEDFVDIITHYMEGGRLLKAKEALRMGLEQHPQDADILILKAEILIFEDRLDAAMTLLCELEKTELSHPEIHIQKANINSKRQHHRKAIACLKSALDCLDEEEEISDIYGLLGIEYLMLEDYTSSIKYYKLCLDRDSEDYAALYNVVYCYEMLQDGDGGIRFLNNFLDKNPYCEIAWHQLGIQYRIKEMNKEALACFDFAMISDSQFVGAYLEKGKVLEDMEKYNDAIAHYQYTLTLEDHTAFAYLRMGLCYRKLGNHNLALEALKKATKQDPQLDKAWYAIAEFYQELEEYDKALDSIRKALDIDPNKRNYWTLYTELCMSLQLDQQSIKGYEWLLYDDNNSSAEQYVNLAQMHIQLGNISKSIDILEEVSLVFVNDVSLMYQLAIAYLMKPINQKGLLLLKKVLNIDYHSHKGFAKMYPQIFHNPEVRSLLNKFKK